ncbi:MAG: YidB family protein [Leptospira sp.]|nr:YidB family protein [Leptospira sp.]
MSLFESIINSALDAVSKANPEYKELANKALGAVQNMGGIEGLHKKFQEKGLGGIAESWISNGENKSVSADDLSDILGKNTIADLAKKSGLSENDAVSKLTAILPNLISGLTPDGKTGDKDLLSSALNILKDKLR